MGNGAEPGSSGHLSSSLAMDSSDDTVTFTGRMTASSSSPGDVGVGLADSSCSFIAAKDSLPRLRSSYLVACLLQPRRRPFGEHDLWFAEAPRAFQSRE
mmetsp:Transcript_26330/g.57761  ORF Transcript_26330/g.57761 Transcript_26330/m.57761 type:complete len:99 (-) Transcript_26330:23-319(-)